MNKLSERETLIVKINSKLKQISDKVNYSTNKDDFSEVSILMNVYDELEDILLNWDSTQIVPDRLIQMFKDHDLDD
jgi:hypothetical protein